MNQKHKCRAAHPILAWIPTLGAEAVKFHNVINNELCSTASTRHSINPADKRPNPEVPVSARKDVNRAAYAAQAAFNHWRKNSFDKRRAALFAYADAIYNNAQEFSKLLTMEQGKPLTQSLTEVAMASAWIRGMTTIEVPVTVLEETENRKVIRRYTPIGFIGAIVPWNFPVALAMGKIVPALYTGCIIIVKPSLFALCLTGEDTLGPMITEHPGIDKIGFTGSIATGKLVIASCARALKRVSLELGGNDPCIICDDVDVDAVVAKVAILSYLCSSQICMMTKRLYVHEKIYDQFFAKFVDFVKHLKVGNGTEPDTFFSPSALGGTIEHSAGYFIHPTIIDNPPETSRVVQEEPFAPILPIMKWSNDDNVLARANALETGLGASVWSNGLERAHRMADQLQAGCVWRF
ncbi:hypothetical protein FE257_001477 [Aspergillus nanangensis]|uniref:aldehyde dehydrogenase (NAD(+)) n=1 Tax=Aspergillus nanangensis TaxID=2582783 RepID=A0AAD4GPJ3_ASPNN|nr:hypothetical protein FE257_001477 [Aspergillus nanangensis]